MTGERSGGRNMCLRPDIRNVRVTPHPSPFPPAHCLTNQRIRRQKVCLGQRLFLVARAQSHKKTQQIICCPHKRLINARTLCRQDALAVPAQIVRNRMLVQSAFAALSDDSTPRQMPGAGTGATAAYPCGWGSKGPGSGRGRLRPAPALGTVEGRGVAASMIGFADRPLAHDQILDLVARQGLEFEQRLGERVQILDAFR